MARRSAVFLLFALLLLPPAPGLANRESALDFLKRISSDVISANHDPSETVMIEIIKRSADVESIGQYAIGSYFPRLPVPDKITYLDGIARFIAKHAAELSHTYKIANVEFIRQRSARGDAFIVDSNVKLLSGSEYRIRWKIRHDGGKYKVEDVKALGFWLTPVLRRQITSFLRKNRGNMDALLAVLNQ